METSSQKSRVIYAPHPYTPHGKSIFLSGSIDKLVPTWQNQLADSLSHLPVTILNPHRVDWDKTWKEDITDAKFRQQVDWELDMMETADVIAVYMGPEAQAPITLLELGLFARTGKIVVACPKGYWKRGNVQVICAKFKIELFDSLDELIPNLIKKLE